MELGRFWVDNHAYRVGINGWCSGFTRYDPLKNLNPVLGGIPGLLEEGISILANKNWSRRHRTRVEGSKASC